MSKKNPHFLHPCLRLGYEPQILNIVEKLYDNTIRDKLKLQ